MRHTHLVLGCIATVIFAGCAGESNLPAATGEGRIRAINAIKTSPTLSVLIEERGLGTVAYKRSTPVATYDDLDYTFNVEAVLAGDILATRVASQLGQRWDLDQCVAVELYLEQLTNELVSGSGVLGIDLDQPTPELDAQVVVVEKAARVMVLQTSQNIVDLTMVMGSFQIPAPLEHGRELIM